MKRERLQCKDIPELVYCQQCGSAGGYDPEPCPKCNATGKMAAPEFPRVWVELWQITGHPGRYSVLAYGKKPFPPAHRDSSVCEYIHRSELERLREAARKVIEAWEREDRTFGDEYETRREPLTSAVELLRKAIGE